MSRCRIYIIVDIVVVKLNV